MKRIFFLCLLQLASAAAFAETVEMKVRFESAHPYPAGVSTRVLWIEGARSIRAHFQSLKLDGNHDQLQILDPSGRKLQEPISSGETRDFWTSDLPAEKIRFIIEDNGIDQRDGFVIDKVVVEYE